MDKPLQGDVAVSKQAFFEVLVSNPKPMLTRMTGGGLRKLRVSVAQLGGL